MRWGKIRLYARKMKAKREKEKREDELKEQLNPIREQDPLPSMTI